MNKAVFLDRDGVVNDNSKSYYVYKPADFVINVGFIKAITFLKENKYLVFIISKQGGISKGIYEKIDTDFVHGKLIDFLEKNDLSIDEIYYCPHHNDIENCFCRKPDSLMIEKLIARFDIDKNESFLIGDSERDIVAGEKAGIRSFLIEPNTGILRLCKSIISDK